MLRNIVAIERDGFKVRTLTIVCEVPSKDFDLISAAKKAATDFCKTNEGREVYIGNCDCFNWADFEVYVPNSFCEIHGFRKVDSVLSDNEVVWDEQIVDESELEEDDE